MPTPFADEPVNLALFDRLSDDRRNRQLLAWLSDDDKRAQLFGQITDQCGGILEFPSRATAPAERPVPTDENPRPPPEIGHAPVFLVTRRDRIESILRDGGKLYSNRLYGELGGGNFMLALDPATSGAQAHAAQVEALYAGLQPNLTMFARTAHEACAAASILSLRANDFDLVSMAEQVALRFCQYLLGYAAGDFPLLERALRANYHALVHQVLGRHFVSDPTAIPQAQRLMAELLRRTGELIDAHAAQDHDLLDSCRPPSALSGLRPVLQLLGDQAGGLNGEQRAVVAVGAAAGTVGNVQAAVCIAVQAFFADEGLHRQVRALALADAGPGPSAHPKEWQRLISRALRLNPPIAFLPRVVLDSREGLPAYSELLLALGGGTREALGFEGDDPLVWGLPNDGKHWCIGHMLAWPLIVETVRHVMGLPGLAEQLDPLDADPIGLEKKWGFICQRYPLTHRRERRVAQSSLNVAMRIKPPVKDNADRLREVIRAGAPRIVEALREARHVHFAWFELIDGDTVLVLHTVYDGPFTAYLQHFALRVGDLFDTLFAYIEDPPPMPVAKFPNEFVAHIQRYNRAPTMGLFFSAYPDSEVAAIVREATTRP